jgi:MATE family multidrug resistance protein
MPQVSSVIYEESKLPLLDDHLCSTIHSNNKNDGHELHDFPQRFWIESKKLWHIVGPAIFFRATNYSMIVITQIFAGHLGDLELAAISLAYNVIIGFDFGLLVPLFSFSLSLYIYPAFLICVHNTRTYLVIHF